MASRGSTMSSVRNGRQGALAAAPATAKLSQRKRRTKRKAPPSDADEPHAPDGTADDVTGTGGRVAKRSRLNGRLKAEATHPMQSPPPSALKSSRRRGGCSRSGSSSLRRRTVCEKLTPNTDVVGDPGWYQPDLSSTQEHERPKGGASFARATRRTLFWVAASNSDGPGPCSYQREISTPVPRNHYRSSRSASTKKPAVPLFDKKPKPTRRRRQRPAKARSAFKAPKAISKVTAKLVAEQAASAHKAVTFDAASAPEVVVEDASTDKPGVALVTVAASGPTAVTEGTRPLNFVMPETTAALADFELQAASLVGAAQVPLESDPHAWEETAAENAPALQDAPPAGQPEVLVVTDVNPKSDDVTSFLQRGAGAKPDAQAEDTRLAGQSKAVTASGENAKPEDAAASQKPGAQARDSSPVARSEPPQASDQKPDSNNLIASQGCVAPDMTPGSPTGTLPENDAKVRDQSPSPAGQTKAPVSSDGSAESGNTTALKELATVDVTPASPIVAVSESDAKVRDPSPSPVGEPGAPVVSGESAQSKNPSAFRELAAPDVTPIGAVLESEDKAREKDEPSVDEREERAESDVEADSDKSNASPSQKVVFYEITSSPPFGTADAEQDAELRDSILKDQPSGALEGGGQADLEEAIPFQETMRSPFGADTESDAELRDSVLKDQPSGSIEGGEQADPEEAIPFQETMRSPFGADTENDVGPRETALEGQQNACFEGDHQAEPEDAGTENAAELRATVLKERPRAPPESDQKAAPAVHDALPELPAPDTKRSAAQSDLEGRVELSVEDAIGQGVLEPANSRRGSMDWCSPDSTPVASHRTTNDDKENMFFSPVTSTRVGQNTPFTHSMKFPSTPAAGIWSQDSALAFATPSTRHALRSLADFPPTPTPTRESSRRANTSFVPLTLREIIGTPAAARVAKAPAPPPMGEVAFAFDSESAVAGAKSENALSRPRPAFGDITNRSKDAKDTSGFLADLWESRHEGASYCEMPGMEAHSLQKGGTTSSQLSAKSEMSANAPLFDKSHSLSSRARLVSRKSAASQPVDKPAPSPLDCSFASEANVSSPFGDKSHPLLQRSFSFFDQENAVPASLREHLRTDQAGATSEGRDATNGRRETERADSQHHDDSSSLPVHAAKRVRFTENAPECVPDNGSAQDTPSEHALLVPGRESSVPRDPQVGPLCESAEIPEEAPRDHESAARHPARHRSRESLWQVFHQRSGLVRRFTMPAAAARRPDGHDADEAARVRRPTHRRATMPNMRVREGFAFRLRAVVALVLWLVALILWLRWLVN